MRRIRTIKPDFWSDGKIAKLNSDTALFFISLWNFSDDYGYFNLDSSERSHSTPRWRPQNVQALLKALEKKGLVRCCRLLGVGLVTGWKHQVIKEKRPSKWNDIEITWDDCENDSPTLLKKEPGKERKGEEGKYTPPPPSVSGRAVAENQTLENGIASAMRAWKFALVKFKISKDAQMDQLDIARAVQRFGPKIIVYAFLGATREPPGEKFDPKMHLEVNRCVTKRSKFSNLAGDVIEMFKKNGIALDENDAPMSLEKFRE